MRVLIIRFTILSGLIFSALAPQAMAATINVTANAPDVLGNNGSCSLIEAITNINDGATTYTDCAPTGAYGTSDTINIPAGTYTATATAATTATGFVYYVCRGFLELSGSVAHELSAFSALFGKRCRA